MADLSTMPTYEARSFARWVAKATEEYFKNPEVKARFEQWLEKNKTENSQTEKG